VIVSDKSRVTIYSDGGASPNPGPGGWGAVLVAGRHNKEICGGEPQTTNNRMELTAAIRALDLLTKPCAIELYTDSQYLRQGITQWIDGWKGRGWRKADGKPVENADLWQELDQAVVEHEIEWHWVKGHRGDPMNERADQLATEGRRRLQLARQGRGAQPELAVVENPLALPIYQAFLSGSALGGKGPAGYAALLVGPDGVERVLDGHWPLATANAMEIWAAVAALRALPERACVVVHSGSKYLLDSAQRYLALWERNGWQTKSGHRVKNAEIWQELGRVMGDHDIRWEHQATGKDQHLMKTAAKAARAQAKQAGPS